ncbi:MAG TPA: DinB family protein [Bryobacteraceae bacterium]|jgi:uncharacterized damage-inducible protein DinB|nr:DinB family protein [Bryobacteraceae bacterium]
MPTDPIAVLTQEWERATAGAAEFLDAMPEDKIDFRPSPDVFTFAEQFIHIGNTNHRFATALNPAGQVPDAPAGSQTKAALKEYVLGGYEAILKGVKSLDPATLDEEVPFHKWTMSRRVILMKALEHHAHHRGQTVIYFRMQGLKPPSERLF